jgi:hypothetical protein
VNAYGKRHSPFVASVEGFLPFVVQVVNGQAIAEYHGVGNVGICSDSINRIKWTHTAPILKAVAQCRVAETRSDMESAMNGLINMYANGLEVAFNLKTRLDQATKLSPNRVDELKVAWKTGDLLKVRHVDDRRLWKTLAHQHAQQKHGARWKPQFHDYLWDQLKQIPPLYGFDDPADIDLWTVVHAETKERIFFPFNKHIAEYLVWTHWICVCWFSKRLIRMKNYCNKKFETECTVEILMMTVLHDRMQKLRADRELMKKSKVNIPSLTSL